MQRPDPGLGPRSLQHLLDRFTFCFIDLQWPKILIHQDEDDAVPLLIQPDLAKPLSGLGIRADLREVVVG